MGGGGGIIHSMSHFNGSGAEKFQSKFQTGLFGS
jgi:hypothetical protein